MISSFCVSFPLPTTQFMMKPSFSLISPTAVRYFSSRVYRARLAVCISFALSLSMISSLRYWPRSSAVVFIQSTERSLSRESLVFFSCSSWSLTCINSSFFSSILSLSNLFSSSCDFKTSSKDGRVALPFNCASSLCNLSMMRLLVICCCWMVGSWSARRIMDLLLPQPQILANWVRSSSLVCCRDLTYSAKFSFYNWDICRSCSNFDTLCFSYFSQDSIFTRYCSYRLGSLVYCLLGFRKVMIFPLSSFRCRQESVLSRLGGEGRSGFVLC